MEQFDLTRIPISNPSFCLEWRLCLLAQHKLQQAVGIASSCLGLVENYQGSPRSHQASILFVRGMRSTGRERDVSYS